MTSDACEGQKDVIETVVVKFKYFVKYTLLNYIFQNIKQSFELMCRQTLYDSIFFRKSRQFQQMSHKS